MTMQSLIADIDDSFCTFMCVCPLTTDSSDHVLYAARALDINRALLQNNTNVSWLVSGVSAAQCCSRARQRRPSLPEPRVRRSTLAGQAAGLGLYS